MNCHTTQVSAVSVRVHMAHARAKRASEKFSPNAPDLRSISLGDGFIRFRQGFHGSDRGILNAKKALTGDAQQGRVHEILT